MENTGKKYTLTIHAGTKYTFEMPDGSQSPVHTFEKDVAALGLHLDDSIYIFELENGLVVFVKPEDDITPEE